MKTKLSNPLSRQITIRLGEEDYLSLREYAKGRGLRLPQLMRSVALERLRLDAQRNHPGSPLPRPGQERA